MHAEGDRGWSPVSFRAQLDGGPAKLTGSVSNLPGGETALVALQFDYRVNADFALAYSTEITIWLMISSRAKSAFTR